MKMSDVFPSNYLKACDFPKPRVLTIKNVRLENLGDESKAVVYFEEGRKGLVLNITNANTIVDLAGSDDSDDWVGTLVEVYVMKVQFQSRMVDGIRVRAPTVKQPDTGPRKSKKQPEPEPDPREFESAPVSDEEVPF